jgi:hypothetical protein
MYRKVLRQLVDGSPRRNGKELTDEQQKGEKWQNDKGSSK